jgi:hypothetical protein
LFRSPRNKVVDSVLGLTNDCMKAYWCITCVFPTEALLLEKYI